MYIIAVTNPCTLPIMYTHHTRLKGVNGRVAFFLPCIPEDHFPKVACKWHQRLSLVRYQLLFRKDFACIPRVSVILEERY